MAAGQLLDGTPAMSLFTAAAALGPAAVSGFAPQTGSLRPSSAAPCLHAAGLRCLAALRPLMADG